MILGLSIGEILSIGSLTALLGIAITFFTLILLVFALYAMEKGIKINFSKKNTQKNDIEQIGSIENNELKSNDPIVAAITATINIIMNDETKVQNKAKANFVVKSIKRI